MTIMINVIKFPKCFSPSSSFNFVRLFYYWNLFMFFVFFLSFFPFDEPKCLVTNLCILYDVIRKYGRQEWKF